MQSVNQIMNSTKRPVKILQFGEGNFLRAFVEYMIDVSNEKGVFDGNIQIIKSIPFGSLDMLRAQDCVYTVLLRGTQNGVEHTEKRVITSVSGATDAYDEYEIFAAFAKSADLRFIVSNTTEAGIVYDESDDISLKPPKTYPGKLTKFLYERFLAFGGAPDKGLIILPTELIQKNGTNLKECCMKLAALWKLPQDFCAWLTGCNTFCNTLVDRIVTGYPKDEAEVLENELGYADKLLVTGEPFALWVIESADPDMIERELPLDKAGLPVIFTNDIQPYRERKVRILNGAHTSTALVAYLSGLDTVGDLMKDKTIRSFLEQAVYGELAPMVPLPDKEIKEFADTVMERFENPFIRHELLAIVLNSVSKFRVRVLPTILETQARTDSLPKALCFSLAAMMSFCSGKRGSENKLIAKRGENTYEIIDDAPVLEFFVDNQALPADQFVQAFLKRTDFWGTDLTQIQGLAAVVTEYLQSIIDLGMRAAVENLLK